MPVKIELQRTGFFREMPHGQPANPSLAEERNATPLPHEDRIAAYLDAGHVAHYVRTYHIGLDGSLLTHMEANHWVVPAEVDLTELAPPAHLEAKADAKTDAATDPKAGDHPRVDLVAVLADFVGAMSGPPNVDREPLQKSIEDASHEALRAIEALGKERPERLLAFAASLEARLDDALASQCRADTTKRATRLSQEIRGTIAQRLREHGLDPGNSDSEK